MTDREFACAVCGHAARHANATFTESDSGKSPLMWTVPVLVYTYPPCLLRQGAVAVPIKKLAS